MANPIFEFWVFRPNLLPSIIIFSKLSELDLEEYIIDEIKEGLIQTSYDRNVWHMKDISGRKKMLIEFAVDDDDSDIVFLKVHFESSLKDKLDICVEILQNFNLEDRYDHFKRIVF